MKPRIRFSAGQWFCMGSGCLGIGFDAKQAYAEWDGMRQKLRSGRFG